MKIRKEFGCTGRARYVVDGKIDGVRKRKIFYSREKAQAEVDRVEKDIKKNGEHIAQYSVAKRATWMMAQQIADETGFNLLTAVQHYRDVSFRACPTQGFKKSVDLFLVRKKATIAKSSYGNLASVMGRFRNEINVDSIHELTEERITKWLRELMHSQGVTSGVEPCTTTTKNGYLKEVRSFCNWAVAENIIEHSPAKRIVNFMQSDKEMIAQENKKQILNIDETARLMELCVQHEPQIVPRVAAMTFLGIRPDNEARGFDYGDITWEEDLFHVKRRFAKDKQDRYILMPANAKAWLSWSKERGHTLPVVGWDRRWNKIKKMLNHEWPHDGLRHSFASHYLQLLGAKKTIDALGHGSYDVLFNHYRTLVKKEEAVEYFNITP